MAKWQALAAQLLVALGVAALLYVGRVCAVFAAGLLLFAVVEKAWSPGGALGMASLVGSVGCGIASVVYLKRKAVGRLVLVSVGAIVLMFLGAVLVGDPAAVAAGSTFNGPATYPTRAGLPRKRVTTSSPLVLVTAGPCASRCTVGVARAFANARQTRLGLPDLVPVLHRRVHRVLRQLGPTSRRCAAARRGASRRTSGWRFGTRERA